MNRDQSDLHIDELLADPFGDIEIPKAEAVK
ncbi:hypothetical protein, partial [Bacillus inaquosorum]